MSETPIADSIDEPAGTSRSGGNLHVEGEAGQARDQHEEWALIARQDVNGWTNEHLPLAVLDVPAGTTDLHFTWTPPPWPTTLVGVERDGVLLAHIAPPVDATGLGDYQHTVS